jgi:DNA-binding GntR family transcriptional regulator
MPSATVSRKPKKGGEVDRVYSLLKGWILDCRFRPGDFLPEVEVAAQCKTSRTPIREACSRLAEEKWLAKIQNRGYIVAPISLQEIIEVYQFRKLLECFTARRTAKLITAEEIAGLRKVIEVESHPNVKMSEVIVANEAFHRAVGKLAQNQRILDQLALILEYVHRLDVLSVQRDTEWVNHDSILAALEAHDVKGAHRAMALHIDNSRDRMLRLFWGRDLPGVR